MRARRPRGWEKLALDIAFLGSPILTIGLPFITKEPSTIYNFNFALLVASYAYGYSFGRGEGAQKVTAFSGALSALDFGSGQERGVRGAAREKLFEQQRASKEADPKEEDEVAKTSA